MAVNALVVFYSRYGETEKLALAAGVGAIQARANIRLRRLTDLAEPDTIQADELWLQNLERMKKDYIAPREIDAQWADLLILASPDNRVEEITRWLGAARENLQGKLAVVLGTFGDAAASAGLKVVPRPEADATSYGRHAAETARTKKGDLHSTA